MKTYCQCTLERDGEGTKRHILVEWVPKAIATLTGKVHVQGHVWEVTHVGAEQVEPRSAHKHKI